MKPVLLVENFLSTRQFPSHTVTASEEAAAHEVYRVATGRRAEIDSWTGSTLNVAHYVSVDCAVVRAANMIAIDRGHNLAGKSVELRVSNDSFVTYESINWTMPSEWAPGSLDDGAYTEEGAYVRRFDVRAGRYWRLYIPAVVSYKPEVVGLWLGLTWYPAEYAVRPHAPDEVAPSFAESASEFGWRGRGKAVAPRSGSLRVRLGSYIDYDHLRRFIEHYKLGRPAWYVPNEDEASTAVLVEVPNGARLAAPTATGWAYPQIDLPYIEREQLIR